MMGYRNDSFAEENADLEAASGLESVEKLIRLLSHAQLQQHRQLQQQSHATNAKSSMKIESDYGAVTDVVVSEFKKVVSLLGRTKPFTRVSEEPMCLLHLLPNPDFTSRRNMELQLGTEYSVFVNPSIEIEYA